MSLTKPQRVTRQVGAILRGRGKRQYDPYDQRANVVDLLTDMRHFCAAKGINFAAAVATSAYHATAEGTREPVAIKNGKPRAIQVLA